MRAANGAVEALAIEVDGVDVTSGRAEGPLLAGLEALARALLALLAGQRRAEVSFAEGGVELLLSRVDAGSALLSIVDLGAPPRLLARDVEVELPGLASAAASACAALALDLVPFGRPLDAAVERFRGLERALARSAATPTSLPPGLQRPLALLRRVRSRPSEPGCAFELHDAAGLLSSHDSAGPDLGSLLAPGRVDLLAADGRILLSSDTPPFLALRHLARGAARLAESARGRATEAALPFLDARRGPLTLRFRLGDGTASAGGERFPCPALPLARALLEAALDLCEAVEAHHPPQARNGWLAELRASSVERLLLVEELLEGDLTGRRRALVAFEAGRRTSHLPTTPLGPGRLRRLSFRRSWELDCGPATGFGLARVEELLVAAGAHALLGLDPASGRERWRREGGLLARLQEGLLLQVREGEGLLAVDARTGGRRWSLPPSALPESLRDVLLLPGERLLLVSTSSCTAVDPHDGRTAWHVAPPAARELRVAVLGPIAVVGSDGGFAYGLEAATGQVAWRVRLPGPLAAPPVAAGSLSLFACQSPLGGGALVAIELGHGQRVFETSLGVPPSGAPLLCGGLLMVAGAVAGDAVVSAVAAGTGELLWESAPPLGPGAPALSECAGGVLAKSADGSSALLDRAGAVLWSRPGRALHPPPANPPALVARGVALVPGEGVAALDAATGELLGELPLPAPVRLAASPSLDAWSVDAAGVVTAARLETHLSLLPGGS